MNFKMQSLTDVWKESKLYVMGFVALLGITIGTAFTYQNVIKPLSSTVSISSVKADDDDGGALRRRVRVLRDGHGRVNGCVRLRVCVRVSDDVLRLLYNRNLCTFSIPSYFLG